VSFKEKIQWDGDKFKDIEHKQVPEFPDHKIYSNGEMWNGKRFLTYGISDNYQVLNLYNNSFKVHRLICYAFHPLPDKIKLEDYEGIQVNHIDGNPLNNNADNLEWSTQNDNMKHAYQTNLNKKKRAVQQYSLQNELIAEFTSISEASRKTGEPEHRIRQLARGKSNSKSPFIWTFKNTDESKEYSKKYSAM